MSQIQQEQQKFFFGNGDWYIGDFTSTREKHCQKGTFYSRDLQTLYIGGFINDYYSGFGTLQNLCTLETLSGTFQDGHAEGKCELSFPNGAKFTGKYVNGAREGYGKWNFVDGSVFEGEYHGNKRNGIGSLTFSNGHLFKGQFIDNMREGKGQVINHRGEVEFEGIYKRGKREGQGKLIFSNGDIYEGMFISDQIEGEGVMKYKDGGEWRGLWNEGRQNGKGVWVKADGTKSEGIWRDGVLEQEINTIPLKEEKQASEYEKNTVAQQTANRSSNALTQNNEGKTSDQKIKEEKKCLCQIF